MALARSLAKRPKVLLLDEPMAALDKKLREETQFELMDLQARLGTAFVIVTHDQEEAMTVAHRIAVMDRGEIIQVATPAEIYEQPKSRWVAAFIGDVNLIEGGVVATDDTGAVMEDRGGRRHSLADGGRATRRTGRHRAAAEKLRIAPCAAARRTAKHGARPVWDIGYLGDVSVYKECNALDGTRDEGIGRQLSRGSSSGRSAGTATRSHAVMGPLRAVLLTR